MSEVPQHRNLSGGELVPAASGAVMDTINPATGEVWAQIPPYLSCGP
jgi:aldehyde dehydrogenase (NAD+)